MRGIRVDRMPLLQNRVSASFSDLAKLPEAKLLLMFFTISCAALLAASAGMHVVITRAIEDEARKTAVQWAQVFDKELAHHHVDMNRLLSGQQPLPADAHFVEIANSIENVFRYRILDADGVTRLGARDAEIGTRTSDPDFAAVMASGQPHAEIERSQDFGPGRRLVGEAYVPILRDGRAVGAIEIYVDMTGRADTVKGFGNTVLIGLASLLAVMGVLKSLCAWRSLRRRRRTEAALLQAKIEAEMANQAKSEFLASMSHELRTPLNSIIGFSEIIATNGMGPVGNARYVEYAGHIHESGQFLLELVNDILDLSKIAAGKATLREQALDMEALVESSLVMVQQAAANGGITLETDLTPATLNADQLKLRQILTNLLANAIRFTPPGGTVSVSVTADAGGGLVLAIADTGVGIAQRDMGRVLEPFGQANNALDGAIRGTGLGLPLAKAFAELHDADLTLDSEIGVGTTVTIRFPAARVIDIGPPIAEPEERVEAG